ncbi:MAG: thiamine diphosphokinase [Synergistaceae bacterium]|jgi:thiamine pyrophosphokinase|nr:thiamine diphosphokinase [Synergistaceae bacterium]
MGVMSVVSSRDVDITVRTDSISGKGIARSLFLLGGRPPEKSWLADLASRNSPKVWAVDSGAASCRLSGIDPSELIGDRDSSSPDDWEWARSRGARERLYNKDKDRTDFQLALSLYIEDVRKTSGRGFGHVLTVSGCFGGALDHLLSIVDTLALDEGPFFRCMMDDREGVFFIHPGITSSIIFSKSPEAVSLLSMTDGCEAGIEGVKWPLDSEIIERRLQWAVSNEVLSSGDGARPVKVSCRRGVLAFCWRF